MPKHPPGPDKQDRLHDVTDPPKLADIGISRGQSSRFQAVADLPEPDFEAHITAVKGRHEEFSACAERPPEAGR